MCRQIFRLDPSTKLEGQTKISVARGFSEHWLIDYATMISIDYRLRLWEAHW